MKQKFFKFEISSKLNIEDFYVTNSNREAYNYVVDNNSNIKNTIIYGPKKSGKSHLGQIWKSTFKAIKYDPNNYELILHNNNNILIDNLFYKINEENLFHIINHCFNNNSKILILANELYFKYNFKLKDLSSRLKSFNFIKINQPDDELIVNIINKLLHDRQIIINNSEIFTYILKRINRTYEDIYLFIKKTDNLSLEKKRELTIPLIKELL